MIKFNIKVQRVLHDNMSQKELSKISGIRLPTLSNYENNTSTSIKVEHLNQLCKIFKCSLSDILSYQDDEEV